MLLFEIILGERLKVLTFHSFEIVLDLETLFIQELDLLKFPSDFSLDGIKCLLRFFEDDIHE